MSSYLWLIPALPLAASAVTALFGPRLLRQHSHWPCILATMTSCALAFLVLYSFKDGGVEIHSSYTWIRAGAVNIGFTLRADSLTAIMLVTVTFVGSLIAIYSAGYMHGDEGYPRFFAEVALFIFSMTGLVLADNYLLLYAFWEGVGVCSYLLVGFWFTKPSAAAAARKAFLVTRLGDLGLFMGILLLWSGSNYSLDYQQVFASAGKHSPEWVFLACVLLFCGAVGKSAQFPLHVWLPDAMEGPTPVSALIHAATMVTAGVYLVARSTPLFILAPGAQLLVACIGCFTALLAALIALTQNDLKRVLAYSTISQLGYMFLALGSGVGKELATLAVVAGIFHLFTHAFFKALLFLSAGSVMHAMGGVIDMRRFSGLRYALPTTHWTFLCGAGALAGFPLLSGFWSKDEILSTTFAASQHVENPYGPVYSILFLIGLITAGLTAFYTFRGYFRTFWGELRIPHEAGEHAHESPPVMTVPLMILAVGAVALGFVLGPLTHFFADVVSRTPGLAKVAEPHMDFVLMGISSVFALAGIGLAWWLYAAQPGLADSVAARIQALYQLSLNKFYLDEIYDFFLVRTMVVLAYFSRFVDFLIDTLVDLVGRLPGALGQLFRPIQNGLAQFYALAMALGLTVFLVALVWRYAG